MDRIARNNQQKQPGTSSAVRNAIDSLRASQLESQMRAGQQMAANGSSGNYIRDVAEPQITNGIESLNRQLEQAQAAANSAQNQQRGAQSLDKTREVIAGLQSLQERMQQQIERDSARRLGSGQEGSGAQGQQSQNSATGQQGQQAQRGGQQGQQNGQQGQQNGQQGQRSGQQGQSGQRGQQGQGQQGQQGQGQQGQQGRGQQGQQGQGQQGQQGQGQQGQGKGKGQGQGQGQGQGDPQQAAADNQAQQPDSQQDAQANGGQ